MGANNEETTHVRVAIGPLERLKRKLLRCYGTINGHLKREATEAIRERARELENSSQQHHLFRQSLRKDVRERLEDLELNLEQFREDRADESGAEVEIRGGELEDCIEAAAGVKDKRTKRKYLNLLMWNAKKIDTYANTNLIGRFSNESYLIKPKGSDNSES